MQHWLLKSEPSTYSWNDLEKEGETAWTGVRNYQARINLKKMRVGDSAFIYHSGEEKSVIGIAKIIREAYPDSTDPEWAAVDIKPVKKLAAPVSLSIIKSIPALKDMKLVRQSRLSVSGLTEEEFKTICKLGGLE